MEKFGSERHAKRRHNDFRMKRKRKKETDEIMDWAYNRGKYTLNAHEYTDEEKKRIEGMHYQSPRACSCDSCVRRKHDGDTIQQRKEFERTTSEINDEEIYYIGKDQQFIIHDEYYFPYRDGLWWYEDDYQEWLKNGD